MRRVLRAIWFRTYRLWFPPDHRPLPAEEMLAAERMALRRREARRQEMVPFDPACAERLVLGYSRHRRRFLVNRPDLLESYLASKRAA